jgi:MFS family permease
LGVPIARLADVFTRKSVMAICLAIWSGMTALCGTASGFAMLLVYRVGVGIGEAGGSPPAHSIISDYFPPERRATALGIFSLGVPIGILIGFLAGGWLDQTLGWRTAFVVVGLPGLLLGLLVAFTLKEPPRGHSEGLKTTGDDSLRYALLVVSCVLPWSAVHFWLGARTLEADVAYVRQQVENS